MVIWKYLRGKGFGRILMQGVEKCAKEFGFKKVSFIIFTGEIGIHNLRISKSGCFPTTPK